MSHLESDNYVERTLDHSFNIQLAYELNSVEEAIFLRHIIYWVDYNRRMKRNFHEGSYWTYQTFDELIAHFPYWTKRQLERIISNLISKGYVKKNNFNQSKYDRTTWYTVRCEIEICQSRSIAPNREMENPEPCNQSHQTVPPIPDNKTQIIKPNIDSRMRATKKIDSSKIERRSLVKTSEEDHSKLVKKLGPELTERCYDDLQAWKESKQETDPKAVDKHTDYYRIVKWVVKSLEENSSSSKLSPEKEQQIYKKFHGERRGNWEVNVSKEGVSFTALVGQGYELFRFKDHGSNTSIQNKLKNLGFI